MAARRPRRRPAGGGTAGRLPPEPDGHVYLRNSPYVQLADHSTELPLERLRGVVVDDPDIDLKNDYFLSKAVPEGARLTVHGELSVDAGTPTIRGTEKTPLFPLRRRRRCDPPFPSASGAHLRRLSRVGVGGHCGFGRRLLLSRRRATRAVRRPRRLLCDLGDQATHPLLVDNNLKEALPQDTHQLA
ncbi:hypothetical protein [Halogeometricum borinquense]|uniref:hypothetical protein n=1 Tax=Halogeometricum borinquense TaxID=60847 RepID=UPI00187D9F20|nr:hypothetical protein [Halogeometricum borinquense]